MADRAGRPPDAPPPPSASGSPGPPVPDGAPARLGPWTTTGRWHAQESGQVLAARGPRGEAEVVVLGAAPALDAAARDRFAAVVERTRRDDPDAVLDADPRGPVPWVALRPGSGPDGARALLDAPLPAGPGDAADGARGPQFRPYWSGVPARYPDAPVPLDRRRRRRWWWWALPVVLLLLLLLLLAACWPPDSAQEPQPSPSPTEPPTQSPTDSPSESPSGSPTPSDSGSPSESPTPSPSGSPSGGPGGTPGPSGSPGPGSEA